MQISLNGFNLNIIMAMWFSAELCSFLHLVSLSLIESFCFVSGFKLIYMNFPVEYHVPRGIVPLQSVMAGSSSCFGPSGWCERYAVTLQYALFLTLSIFIYTEKSLNNVPEKSKTSLFDASENRRCCIQLLLERSKSSGYPRIEFTHFYWAGVEYACRHSDVGYLALGQCTEQFCQVSDNDMA